MPGGWPRPSAVHSPRDLAYLCCWTAEGWAGKTSPVWSWSWPSPCVKQWKLKTSCLPLGFIWAIIRKPHPNSSMQTVLVYVSDEYSTTFVNCSTRRQRSQEFTCALKVTVYLVETKKNIFLPEILIFFITLLDSLLIFTLTVIGCPW